jgi:hypothetical protein
MQMSHYLENLVFAFAWLKVIATLYPGASAGI